MYMNENEIAEALWKYRQHPVLGPATQTLANLVVWTNSHSDGWAYWPRPSKAAAKLQQLIQGDDPSARFDDERADATPEKLAAALRPIKAFRTRQEAVFEIVTSLDVAPTTPSTPRIEEQIAEIVGERGWSDATIGVLAARFIIDTGHGPAFLDYLRATS